MSSEYPGRSGTISNSAAWLWQNTLLQSCNCCLKFTQCTPSTIWHKPTIYPIYRPLCLLGIDACIYRDMLKWNKSSFLQKLVAAWMRILLTFLISNVSWVLANITFESSHCFRKGNRNSGRRLCIMVCPSFWEDYYMLIYTHCWELMNSVGSHGSLSLPFVMKVMVCHFVSDSHEVMTALIVVLPLIVVVEISLQLHRSYPLT